MKFKIFLFVAAILLFLAQISLASPPTIDDLRKHFQQTSKNNHNLRGPPIAAEELVNKKLAF